MNKIKIFDESLFSFFLIVDVPKVVKRRKKISIKLTQKADNIILIYYTSVRILKSNLYFIYKGRRVTKCY